MGAAALRLVDLRAVVGDQFYDAAVRSMGHSWHNFFFGAVEPSGTISLDKPPIDLWLQVLSTKVIGYSLFALHLPEALAGAAAAGLLFGALRRTFGAPAALLGAIALAVLPESVLTSRSDTMDSLLAALCAGALWLSLEALHTGRRRWIWLAAGVMGLAFNVKLTEALIPLPALALLWWWAAGVPAPGASRSTEAARAAAGRVGDAVANSARRARTLALAAGSFVAVAMVWTLPAALVPLSDRPFPIGSTTGSIWRLVFVYNGVDRISGHGPVGLTSSAPGGGPGLARLFSTGYSNFGQRIGIELLAALALGALALAAYVPALAARSEKGWLIHAPRTPEARAVAALVVWLVLGFALFSVMRRLQTRYLEAFSPAIAALLGIAAWRTLRERAAWRRLALVAIAFGVAGDALAAERSTQPEGIAALAGAGVLGAVTLASLLAGNRPGERVARRVGVVSALLAPPALCAALFAAPIGLDVSIIDYHLSDSTLADPTTPAMSRYLLAHRDGARYELASPNVLDVMAIVARDGLPVLVLNDLHGPIVTLPQLQRKVASHQVRFILLRHPCAGGLHCPPTVSWSYHHSVRVTRDGLYRFVVAS